MPIVVHVDGNICDVFMVPHCPQVERFPTHRYGHGSVPTTCLTAERRKCLVGCTHIVVVIVPKVELQVVDSTDGRHMTVRVREALRNAYLASAIGIVGAVRGDGRGGWGPPTARNPGIYSGTVCKIIVWFLEIKTRFGYQSEIAEVGICK